MMTNALREIVGLQPQLTNEWILCRFVWQWQVLSVCWQEAQLMLTNPRDAMIDYIFSRLPGFATLFAITEKFTARRPLLFEVQRVTSPRLPWLRGFIPLFSTYCSHNRIQTVCN